MAKIDYYCFSVFQPYKVNAECHKTLYAAKQAYLEHRSKGHKLGCTIYGHSRKDDCVSLTYTPWYSDTLSFGKTELTYMGRSLKNKRKH